MSDYHEAIFGRDEPELIFGSGKWIKYMAEQCGDPAEADQNGNLILDDAMYILTKEGIFPA